MKTWAVVVVLAACLVGAGIRIDWAAARTVSPVAATANGNSVMHLHAITTSFVYRQYGKKAGPGDSFVAADDLFRDGRKVGQDAIKCDIVSGPVGLASGEEICVQTLYLEGQGQIATQARYGLTQSPFLSAVTGGTNAFQGVTGQEIVYPGSTKADYTLQLSGGCQTGHC